MRPFLTLFRTIFTVGLFLGTSALAQAPFPLTPYEATYQVAWHGINVGRSVHILDVVEGKGYQFSSRTQPFLAFIPYEFNEVSQFVWKENEIIPLSYAFYNREGGKKHQGHYIFNHETHRLTDRQAEGWSIAFEAPLFDQATQALALRIDSMNHSLPKPYKVINKNEIKSWLFKQEKEEVLQTAIGPLKTIKIHTINGDRETTLWLAKEKNHLLVQLIQQRKGKVQIEARLVSHRSL